MSSHDNHTSGGYERQDFDFTHLLWVIPASIAMLVTYVLICMFGFRGAATAEMIEKHSILADTTLVDFKAKEAALLSNYGWENKENGAVRIPIDQAMNSVVKGYNSANSQPTQPAKH